MARLIAGLILGALLAVPVPSFPHVVLDPELVHGILVDIAQTHKASRDGPNTEARVEALYRLGEKVQGLVELMNQDLSSHRQSDPFVQLLLRRLQAYGVRIVFREQQRRYAYDQAAFREYLNLVPQGKRAPEARFQVIARTFYETLGADPSRLVETDVPGLLTATTEAEQFLKEYPRHERAKDVQFFLAVDYYRLLKNVKDPIRAREYERLAREALERVVTRYPGSVEARAAEALLEGLKGGGS